jgi:hypothetical protein
MCDDWKNFSWRWGMCLEQLKRPFVHTSKYQHEFWLSDHDITDEDVCVILAPFIETIKTTMLKSKSVISVWLHSEKVSIATRIVRRLSWEVSRIQLPEPKSTFGRFAVLEEGRSMVIQLHDVKKSADAIRFEPVRSRRTRSVQAILRELSVGEEKSLLFDAARAKVTNRLPLVPEWSQKNCWRI